MSDRNKEFDLENVVEVDYMMDCLKYFLDNSTDPNNKKINGMFEGMRSLYREHKRASPEYLPKEYVGYKFALTAYEYILDNGGSREEALEHSRIIHEKTIEWINDVKNRPYFYTKRVVKTFDTHEEQKLMLSNGTMDKSALMQKQSINQQLGRLSRYKQISDTLEELKENDSQQKQAIGSLEDTVVSHEMDIDRLKEVNQLSEMSPKDKAIKLKAKGYTQKSISKMVGKSERTVRNWWKDI